MNHEDRSYWRDRARDVLPSATAREIVRAAHILRLQYSAPEAVYDVRGSSLATATAPRLDVQAFDGVTGGGVPDMTGAPDAYSATRHQMRGDMTVARYGMARVQGACWSIDDTPSGFSPALMGQMLSDLPRNSIGAASLDVFKLTEAFYGADDQLEPLIGTDVRGYKQERINGLSWDRPGQLSIAGVSVDVPSVGKVAPWRTRTTLGRVQARKTERVGASAAAMAAPALHTGRTVWHLAPVAPVRSTREFVCTGRNRSIVCGYLGYWRDTITADTVTDHTGRAITQAVALEYVPRDETGEHVWIGYKRIPRGKVAAKHKPRQVKVARTLGTFHVETPLALATLADNMNRDDRVIAIVGGLSVTLARGKGKAGTYSATTPAGKASGMRTGANVAKRVFELLAS